MRELTHQGKTMLAFQAQMATVHKYKPIPIDLFNGNIRDKYIKELPEWCFWDDKSDALDHLFAESAYVTDNQIPLYDREGLQICSGYHRIVIGDYGAFVEIPESMICQENIMCKKGQEYREKDEKYKNVKYLWYTGKNTADCKIYLQKKTVDYADYVPGMMFIKCNSDDGVAWINIDHVKRIEEVKNSEDRICGYNLYCIDNYIFFSNQLSVIGKFLRNQ